MTSKRTKAAEVADAKAAASIEPRVRKLARLANLIPKAASKHSPRPLPAKLEPDLIISERRLMHKAMSYFEARFRAGRPVFHVTWCPIKFRTPEGTLDAAVVKRLRDLASRHARNVPTSIGRRLIGAVDISFNAEGPGSNAGVYCVHVHALAVSGDKNDKRARRRWREAFRERAPSEAGSTIKPTQIKSVRDDTHLRQVIGYASGCLALVDHNPQQNRHRRLRVTTPSSKFSSDEMLPDELQTEVTRLFAEVGPAGFWVLSGFHRRGKDIRPDPPFSDREKADLKAFKQHRKAVRHQLEANPLSFTAIDEKKRLF